MDLISQRDKYASFSQGWPTQSVVFMLPAPLMLVVPHAPEVS